MKIIIILSLVLASSHVIAQFKMDTSKVTVEKLFDEINKTRTNNGLPKLSLYKKGMKECDSLVRAFKTNESDFIESQKVIKFYRLGYIKVYVDTNVFRTTLFYGQDENWRTLLEKSISGVYISMIDRGRDRFIVFKTYEINARTLR
jgi:hypothetical protein